MGRTVYALTEGAYSDFRILALFETREDATEALNRFGESIREYPMFGPEDCPAMRSWPQVVAAVRFDDDLVLHDDRPFHLSATLWDSEPAPQDDGIRRNRQGTWVVSATATTAEAARKAARERAAQVVAQLQDGLDPLTVTVERR